MKIGTNQVNSIISYATCYEENWNRVKADRGHSTQWLRKISLEGMTLEQSLDKTKASRVEISM